MKEAGGGGAGFEVFRFGWVVFRLMDRRGRGDEGCEIGDGRW